MKATHKGSCQGCGATQMLPGGVLAKHGYTVQWGFFSGVCMGSGYKPYETHTDLIEKTIARAEAHKAEAEAFKAALLAPPAEGTTEAWVRCYRRNTGGYQWMKRTLTFTVQTSTVTDSQWMTVRYEDPDSKGRLVPARLHEIRSLNPLDFVFALNQKRAQAVADDIKKIEEYIAWQRRRIAEWKEQPLTPR